MKDYFKRIVKKYLPISLRRKLLHPMIVPRDYSREIHHIESIISMMQKEDNLDDEYWASQLRMYTHIIGKGLQRCDCQPGHSKDFLAMAITAADSLKSEEIKRDPSIVWAIEKIKEYKKLQEEGRKNRVDTPVINTQCKYEDLINVIKTRRSIRNFLNKPVPRSEIEKIVEVATWSPHSCNRQTMRIFVADSNEGVRKCMALNSGATCFNDTAPCFISFCSDLRAYNMPSEMALPFLDIALGIQNSCLVAHSLGLGMTILNWTQHTDEQDEQLRSLLGIPHYCRIIANAVVGYPGQGAPVPERKSKSSTYFFVR